MRPPVIILFAAIAVLACVAPAQNDTWWHLRSGLEMARTHELLFVDRFSFTATGRFFWNHSWGSQLVFYGLDRLGGLPAVAAACALAVIAGWAFAWRLTRGASLDRALLLAAAVSSATVTWSVRPQAFSALLLGLSAWMIASNRWRWLPVVFALWANLHAGFALGGLVLVAGVLATLIWQPDAWRWRTLWALSSAAATAFTPLGVFNWIEVARSLNRSQVNAIQEWLPTPFAPQYLAFWGLAALLIALAVTRGRRVSSVGDGFLLIAALLTLPLAVRALRNVPAFAMLAAPAASRLLFAEPKTVDRRITASARAITAVAVAAACLVVTIAWTTRWPRLGWDPISPDAARAISSCPGPLYNTYEAGGPIIWFAPSQPVFVDSRQDPYPVELIQAATEVERTGNYSAVFSRWDIRCAALSPRSLTAARLEGDGWVTRFRDDGWIVLSRPSPSTATTPSQAP